VKVSINAAGREVTIETLSDQNLTHADVADKALEVWKETGGDPEGLEGPAYGFTAERRERWQAPGHLGDHGMREVKA
jgi:hypothetical protein